MDLENVTNLPPRTLMLVVAGGAVLGFGWRFMSKDKQPSTIEVPEQISYLDDYMNTRLETVGNRRDLYGNEMDLPILSYLYRGADGILYRTDDAGNLVPVAGTGTDTGGSTGGSTGDTATRWIILYNWKDSHDKWQYKSKPEGDPPPRGYVVAQTQGRQTTTQRQGDPNQ